MRFLKNLVTAAQTLQTSHLFSAFLHAKTLRAEEGGSADCGTTDCKQGNWRHCMLSKSFHFLELKKRGGMQTVPNFKWENVN